ncbi:MAG: hypothetical protein V7642_2661 [Burkholderiales bacterium]
MKMQMRVVVQIATAGRIGRLSDMAKRKTIEELFKNRHFEQKVIILCCRCRRYKGAAQE